MSGQFPAVGPHQVANGIPPPGEGDPAQPGANDELALKLLKSKEFNTAMVVLTIYALVADDIRLYAFGVNDDMLFYIISLIAMLMFLLEMVLQWKFRPEYRWGFYFVLDVLSTGSMVPDTGSLILPQDELDDDTATKYVPLSK